MKFHSSTENKNTYNVKSSIFCRSFSYNERRKSIKYFLFHASLNFKLLIKLGIILFWFQKAASITIWDKVPGQLLNILQKIV